MPKLLSNPEWYDKDSQEVQGYDKGTAGHVLLGTGEKKPVWKDPEGDDGLRVKYAKNGGRAKFADKAGSADSAESANKFNEFDWSKIAPYFKDGTVLISTEDSSPFGEDWEQLPSKSVSAIQGIVNPPYYAYIKRSALDYYVIYDTTRSVENQNVYITPSRKKISNSQMDLSLEFDNTVVPLHQYYKIVSDEQGKFDGNNYLILLRNDGLIQPFILTGLNLNRDVYIYIPEGLDGQISTVSCHNSLSSDVQFGRSKYYVKQNDSEVNYKVRINKDSEDGAVIFTPDTTITPQTEFVNNNTQLITYSIRGNADLWAQDWTDYYKYSSNQDGFKTRYNDGQIAVYKWLNLPGYTGEYPPDACDGKAWIEVPNSASVGTDYYICLTTNTDRKILIQFNKSSAPVVTYTGTFQGVSGLLNWLSTSKTTTTSSMSNELNFLSEAEDWATVYKTAGNASIKMNGVTKYPIEKGRTAEIDITGIASDFTIKAEIFNESEGSTVHTYTSNDAIRLNNWWQQPWNTIEISSDYGANLGLNIEKGDDDKWYIVGNDLGSKRGSYVINIEACNENFDGNCDIIIKFPLI